MRVNELAKEAGVRPHVIRYYTERGFLKPRREAGNKYRDYTQSDIYRVKFVRRAKWLGFTLSDVRAILNDADDGVSPCPEVREIIKHRSSQNHQRLQDLMHLQRRIDQAVARWDTLPDQPPSHESLCHLIDTVAEADGDLP